MLPIQAVLAFLWPLRPRPAVIVGTALSLGAYVAIFAAWVFSRHDHDASLAWVDYLLCLPGAVVGEILASLWLRDRFTNSAIATVGIAASTVLAGSALNQTIVCKTEMYCG